MQLKDVKEKTTVVVIGAGAAGLSAALNLAEKGYHVELLEKNTVGSGSSGNNPGRMGHGFHYSDIDTAIAYLRASILVQRVYPGYLVGQELPFEDPVRHGRYFITKDSNPDKNTILASYDALKEEYKKLILEDPENEVFGPIETFFRILDPSEYQDTVNMDIVDIGIETSEHLFKWQDFIKDIKQTLLGHPNITLREHTEVVDMSKNAVGDARFTIEALTSDKETVTLKTDYIVNSTWQDIKRLNNMLGITMVPGERTNRLKTLIELELPASLKNSHSMFFCMGQHCMISNLGNGRAMATFAKVTNMETSSELCMSEKAQRLLSGGATVEEKENIAREMLLGISKYIPEIAKAKIIDTKFGVVQTKGTLTLMDLNNPTHPFNKRDDLCVKAEQIGVISNPCMKLFYFVENGQAVGNLIDEQMDATLVIKRCMGLIQEKAKQQDIPLDDVLERAILRDLERREISSLTAENSDKIVNSVISSLKVETSTLSFFSKENTQSLKPTNTKDDIYKLKSM